jgi:hypothetical protein
VTWTEIPESAVQEGARHFGEESPFGKVLAEAAEIRARGGLVKFVLSERGALAVQEGVLDTSHKRGVE